MSMCQIFFMCEYLFFKKLGILKKQLHGFWLEVELNQKGFDTYLNVVLKVADLIRILFCR